MSRFTARAMALALLSLLLTLSLLADSMSAAKGISPAQPRTFPQPVLRAQATSAAGVIASLEATAQHEIESLRKWNESNDPARIGIVKELPERVAVGNDMVAASAGQPWRWRGAVQAEGASRVRLKLTNVELPNDAILWVYGNSGNAIGFDASLAHAGTLWTPSVDGDTITLEVQAPAGQSVSLDVAAVLDLRNPREVIATGEECIKDAKCETGLDEFGGAVAHMQYISGNSAYVCSGGLIIDSRQTFTPYFLTANHCISTAAEAASLETFWDYKAASCGGAPPSLGSLPRTSGSVILATDAPLDVSLLRLPSVPAGQRYFLGWTSTAVTAGTNLFRISHPGGQPQRFSISQVETSSATCQDTPRTRYIYSRPTYGTVVGGSSGSPVVLSDGRIVGQLSGGCPGSANPCGTEMRTVDGSFSAAYPTLLKPYLNPEQTQCSACVPNANTACMLNGRFKVTLTWNDPSANLSGNGRLINYSENRPISNPADGEVSQVTFWSMYPNDPNSVEALVRMIRGGSSFWILTTGFAAAEYTVTVLDTQKCNTWQRTSAFGAREKIADYNALPF